MRRTLLVPLLLAGCISPGDDLESTSTTAAPVLGALATETLALGDLFLPFAPGFFGYDRHRGTLSNHGVFFNFGLGADNVDPNISVQPLWDIPDHKKRLRFEISETDPLQNPSGDIIVEGLIYEADVDDPLATPPGVFVDEVVHIVTNGTYTTETYFDEITAIRTEGAGLGMNTRLDTWWWDGHEQEMGVGVQLDGITDPGICEEDWLVYFNGQVAEPAWDINTLRCTAGLLPLGSQRGLYFGVAPDYDAEDAFHRFGPGGHTGVTTTWWSWLATLGVSSMYFAVDDHATNETRIRPIVVQLERQSDLAIVDSARWLLTIATGPYGQPSLVAMAPATESPGATAQLSPRGLDRLEPTHADTLPYPIVPAGTQPRLSQRAIDAPEHRSPEVTVDIDDLPEADHDYWTEPNPAGTGDEFAGYLALEDILAAAEGTKDAFDVAIQACDSTPNPGVCKLGVRLTFCVETNPEKDDFRIRIDGVDTYFDPARPDDALVIGDVTGMDLEFVSNSISADFTLEDIQGWLEASIDPSRIWIEWDTIPLDPCTIKPAARSLADYDDGVDYADWLVCHDLSFAAGSGTLADPVEFDIVANVEQIDTPYAPGLPDVNLASVTTDPGTGICDQEWLEPTITTELTDWQPAVESTIAVELVTSPGEDEALNRLLSPYELGVERIDAPPPGTPPYEVHPLSTYALSARIGKTVSDLFGAHANPTDGLYLPYLTRSSAVGSVPFLTWFCPVAAGQFCTGLGDDHEPMLALGLDPDGDPYDVALNYTTAHLSHALWAQARRADRLGSPGAPARLTLAANAIRNRASVLGFTDVVQALDLAGSSFNVRFYEQAAPYTIITDGAGFDPPKLIYVVPNVVLELYTTTPAGGEKVVAKMVVDVVDYDHELAFSTGGIPILSAAWGQRVAPMITTTHLPRCYGARGTPSCDGQLRQVIGSLWMTGVQAMLLDLMEQAPALQLFDAGQESGRPRELKNVRTFLVNEGVQLVGDLCNPANDPLCQ